MTVATRFGLSGAVSRRMFLQSLFATGAGAAGSARWPFAAHELLRCIWARCSSNEQMKAQRDDTPLSAPQAEDVHRLLHS